MTTTNRLLGESTLDFAALTPLANLYTEYLVFVVRPDSSLQSAQQLLTQLGNDPGGIRIAFATAIGAVWAFRVDFSGTGDWINRQIDHFQHHEPAPAAEPALGS